MGEGVLIIVTGVDGSGTSAVVGALDKMGVKFPGPYTFNPSRENVVARRINDKIMIDLVGEGWGKFPNYNEIVEYDTAITNEIGEINWKDPRASVLLPVWRDRKPRVVWVKRSPANVASSWLKRKRLYPRPGYDTRQRVYQFIVNHEGYLFFSLAHFEIEYYVTVYEDWYKHGNVQEVEDVLRFCGKTGVSGQEIRDVLDEMLMPTND